MSGDNTEEPQNPGEDAIASASAPDSPIAAGDVEPYAVPAPETVTTPDAEAAIEEFEVPPPPQFASAPPPDPEPVIPPASVDAGAGAATRRKRSTWTPDDTWTSESAHKQDAVPLTAAQKAESRAAASRAATARDEATRNYVSPAAGGTDGQSYRGWTVAIYGGLTVLLFAAVGFMVFLGVPG